MLLWLLLLPLALYAKCGWGCIPAAALVSLALLTIEAIGVSLEEPFSILALETICENCGRGIATLMEMDGAAYALAVSASTTAQPFVAAGDAAAAGVRIYSNTGSMSSGDYDDDEAAGGGGGGGSGGAGGRPPSVARKVAGAVSGR